MLKEDAKMENAEHNRDVKMIRRRQDGKCSTLQRCENAKEETKWKTLNITEM
jgi:hypothetical protein